MSEQTLYTFGYQGSSPDDLAAYQRALRALVVDVRLVPWSKDVRFCDVALRRLLGENYLSVKEFGNVNYRRPDLGFLIKAPAAGIDRLQPYHGAGRAMILLCRCPSPQSCHRRLVATLLQGSWGGGTVIDLPPRYALWRRSRPRLFGG